MDGFSVFMIVVAVLMVGGGILFSVLMTRSKKKAGKTCASCKLLPFPS